MHPAPPAFLTCLPPFPQVVDNKTGKSVDSTVRTSSGTFLARGEDEVVKAIEKRLSLITMIPEGGCSRGGPSQAFRACCSGCRLWC